VTGSLSAGLVLWWSAWLLPTSIVVAVRRIY
jgi:hypothetical protein